MSSLYFFAVEVEALFPIADLAKSLQRCYDNGAAGDFKILTTSGPAFMVIFRRNAADDAEYITKRYDAEPEVSAEIHAQQQLAGELNYEELDDSASHLIMPLIETLKSGKAQCFDFSFGVFEQLIGADAS